MKKEWFAEWFDSKYYHILYQNHNDIDAKRFIDNLLVHLRIEFGAHILDLACGKGRHSKYMASKGYHVIGMDLSKESIEAARQFENTNLSFFSHDMRHPYHINYFDYIFNFFTSFGYFNCVDDNLRALKNVRKGLKPNGVFVLDYFNANHVKRVIKPMEVKTVNGIDFKIQKKIEGDFIVKSIAFEANGQQYNFEERVQLFSLAEFERLFEAAGLHITQCYGDYSLNAFEPSLSPRLILVAKKN